MTPWFPDLVQNGSVEGGDIPDIGDRQATAHPEGIEAAQGVAWKVPSTWGMINAADAPCAIRAPTSTSIFGAIPQTSELSVNPASPVINTVRRP